MRLLEAFSIIAHNEARAIKLVEFFGQIPPRYAILSHTWGDDEVLFKDIERGTARQRRGFHKLRYAAEQAVKDFFRYVWIDTCCIDKSSSAELQETINSMYKWYKKSEVCYVYLTDVHVDMEDDDMILHKVETSRWFTRGWTVQELLAPRKIKFYGASWINLGILDKHKLNNKDTAHGKSPLVCTIVSATGIHDAVLSRAKSGYDDLSVALRMSWFARRQTTRQEDKAYCMLGVFDINMPLLYGEGAKAFQRLQEEIMKHSDDHSLFSWILPHNEISYNDHDGRVLAIDPDYFKNCETSNATAEHPEGKWSNQAPYLMTNKGLQIELPIKHIYEDIDLATLDLNFSSYCDCKPRGVFLKRLDPTKSFYSRVLYDKLGLGDKGAPGDLKTIYIRPQNLLRQHERRFRIRADLSSHLTTQYTLVRVFSPCASTQNEALDGVAEFLRWSMLQQIVFVDMFDMLSNVLYIKHIASNDVIAIRFGLHRETWRAESLMVKNVEHVWPLQSMSEDHIEHGSSKVIKLASELEPDIASHYLTISAVSDGFDDALFTIGIQSLRPSCVKNDLTQLQAKPEDSPRIHSEGHLAHSHCIRNGRLAREFEFSVDDDPGS